MAQHEVVATSHGCRSFGASDGIKLATRCERVRVVQMWQRSCAVHVTLWPSRRLVAMHGRKDPNCLRRTASGLLKLVVDGALARSDIDAGVVVHKGW